MRMDGKAVVEARASAGVEVAAAVAAAWVTD